METEPQITSTNYVAMYEEAKEHIQTLRRRYETLANKNDQIVAGFHELIKHMEDTLLDEDFESIMSVVEELFGQFIDLPEKEVEFSATITVKIEGTAKVARGKDLESEIISMLEYDVDAESLIQGHETTVDSADAEIDYVEINN